MQQIGSTSAIAVSSPRYFKKLKLFKAEQRLKISMRYGLYNKLHHHIIISKPAISFPTRFAICTMQQKQIRVL